MDPRHPEQAITRIKELINQFDRVMKDMSNVTVSPDLGRLEREGGLVVQEICLVAPRLHEAMMQSSRQRRHELVNGVMFEMPKYEAKEEVVDALKKAKVDFVETEIAEEQKPEVKPKKKTTKKKKVEE